MQLKSFGCSFIFGSDLSDADPNLPLPSQNTWPALFSWHLGYEYSCYARPGSGNLQILEKILNQSADNNNDMFVINWSWIDRFDYYNPDYTRDTGDLWQDWTTIMPAIDTETAKIYYRDLHSEYCDKFTNLSYIKLAIDALTQKGIPFIMTYIDTLMFDQQWHVTPAVIDLQNYIKPYMTTFDGGTFLEWSRKNNYPISEAWHPLEQAHRAAGDYMIKVFDKQNTIDR